MLKKSDLKGQRSKQALDIINRGLGHNATVEAINKLFKGADPVETEEMSWLLEGYIVENPPPSPEDIMSDLDRELDRIARQSARKSGGTIPPRRKK